MKRILPLLLCLLLLTGCGGNTSDSSYEQITQEAAKEMVDSQEAVSYTQHRAHETRRDHVCRSIL